MTRFSIAAGPVLVLGLALPAPAQGQGLTVFDPANYEQNLLQGVRALDTVNNQIRQLQNETQALELMTRNLQTLPGSVAPQLSKVLSNLQRQVASGNAIALTVEDTKAQFEQLFPKAATSGATAANPVQDALARWQEAHASLERAALVQGQIVDNAAADQTTLTDILGRSQGASGALQAAQAGNELQALNVKQAVQLQTLMAAQARADTVDRSRALAAQEAARQQFKTFLGDGHAYTRR